jgi:arabinan endo-1,5-alpha-L-arabinosidase
VGYNSGTGNWIDLNNPNDVTPTHIAVNKWQLVTMTVSRTGGITLYVNGAKKAFSKCKGSAGGKEFTTEKSFDYAELVDFVSSCPTLCLGKGSFWGSPKASFDDVIVYDHPITIAQLNSLKLMENRAYDFRSLTDGIEQVVDVAKPQTTGVIYDLLGRRVARPASGIYIKGGKKYVVR